MSRAFCDIIEWCDPRTVLAVREVVMRFHPKGLLVVAALAAMVMLAVDVRWGIAAIVAGTVIDWLSFALPLGLGRGVRGPRDRRPD
jgi:hypothetical protein